MIFAFILTASIFSVTPIRLVCPESQKNAVYVDGILNEWDQLTPLSLGKGDVVKGASKMRGRTDLQADLKCTYVKGEGMYFLIDVTDSRIIRNKRPKKGDDHFIFSINGKRNKLRVFPAYRKYKGVVKGKTKGLKIKIVKRELGYALELGIPWGKFGIKNGLPTMLFNLTIFDTDSSVSGKPETILSLDQKKFPKMTNLEFGGARALFNNMLSKLMLSKTDVRTQEIGNFARGKGIERAFLADRFLAVIGGDIGANFFYTPLANNAKDVTGFKVLDIDGDKVKEILVEFKYSNDVSTWKAVSVYKLYPRGLKRIFSHLLEFKSGVHFIKNSYKLKKKHRKYKMIFKFKKASKTIKKKSWKGNPPDQGTVDFLFPWSPKKETFWFSNGSYSGGR